MIDSWLEQNENTRRIKALGSGMSSLSSVLEILGALYFNGAQLSSNATRISIVGSGLRLTEILPSVFEHVLSGSNAATFTSHYCDVQWPRSKPSNDAKSIQLL